MMAKTDKFVESRNIYEPMNLFCMFQIKRDSFQSCCVVKDIRLKYISSNKRYFIPKRIQNMAEYANQCKQVLVKKLHS